MAFFFFFLSAQRMLPGLCLGRLQPAASIDFHSKTDNPILTDRRGIASSSSEFSSNKEAMTGAIFLSAFLQVTFDRLASPLLTEFGLLAGVDDELKRLKSVLETIQAVHEDAEERQEKDKAMKIWLANIKEVIYDANDILDKFATKSLRRKLDDQDQMEVHDRAMNMVKNLFSASKPFLFRVKMAHKIKKIVDRLEVIASKRTKFHLKEQERREEVRDERQTVSALIECVYGRTEERERLIELLVDTGKEAEVAVIPIVGMAGIGKTTLAKLAYNDERLEGRFDVRMWICVSDNFNVRSISKEMLESVTMNTCDISNMDSLLSSLQKRLKGQRFLLVLDDVWNDNFARWDQLKHFLRGGARGSKIIVTTRNEKVAQMMGTIAPYHLNCLSDDDCWSLFKHHAFQQGWQDERLRYIAIGKEIVQKCRGVPLAAKALGSLLRFKRSEREWTLVKDSEIWDLPKEENEILPALKLSYDYLPSHLKQCFAYCAIFPKDHIFEKDKLIQLWMAEGFIQPSRRRALMEDIGEEYFNDLLLRSFFQDVERDDEGNVTGCKMHDLIHDLARSVAGTECSIVVAGSAEVIPETTRHISLVCNSRRQSVNLEALQKAKKLRTFLLLGKQQYKEIPENICSAFSFLRVLDLSGSFLTGLPISIGNLELLRYLDLSMTQIEKMPDSISSLVNLETLKLYDCYFLQELPKNMRNMISLRHLMINSFDLLSHMPKRIGELRLLQTLPIFIVGNENGCGIGELQGLNLRGKLAIKNLQNVTDAREAKLEEKQNLQSLELSWGHLIDDVFTENADDVLEGLKPPTELKQLYVHDYRGLRFPSWMMDPILNLTEISFIGCKRCERLPPLGRLPFLRFLFIKGMDAVNYINSEFYGNGAVAFPSLKELTLSGLPNLEEWLGADGIELFPLLGNLTINQCPKLSALPPLPSLKNLSLTHKTNSSLLRSLASLNTLSSLVIHDVPETTSLPGQFLQNHTLLQSLQIMNCPNLRTLSTELDNLVSLKQLHIAHCKKLTSFPIGLQNLSCLEVWEIKECSGLVSLPDDGMHGLSSLKKLSIEKCDILEHLPRGLGYLHSLQELHIIACPSLVSLPEELKNLKSLKTMKIWWCASLASLPEGVRCLTSLRLLWIWKCPFLSRRCEEGKGEDWSKIAHIPNIHLDRQWIQHMAVESPSTSTSID